MDSGTVMGSEAQKKSLRPEIKNTVIMGAEFSACESAVYTGLVSAE